MKRTKTTTSMESKQGVVIGAKALIQYACFVSMTIVCFQHMSISLMPLTKPMIRGGASTKEPRERFRSDENSEHETIEIRRRDLWRNETPRDDDDDDDHFPVDGHDTVTNQREIRPGLATMAAMKIDEELRQNVGNVDQEAAGIIVDGNDEKDAVVDTDPDEMSDEILESVHGVIIGDYNETFVLEIDDIDDENFEAFDEDAEDGMQESSNATYSQNTNAPETIPLTEQQEGTNYISDPSKEDVVNALAEGPNHENKLDCLWRVLTGTTCSSILDGDIVNGYQHEYLVADGQCRYNDFLGYYRAGCQRPISEGEEVSLQIRANFVLKDVFCTDPTCSMGCSNQSVIRPDVVYTSHFCYLSSNYDGTEGSDNGTIENIPGAISNLAVGLISKNADYEFSFEFVGGCLESENCNIVE